jgi:small subunit ribosomal protein S20
MPVTKSAKGAQIVSNRRHAENLIQRAAFRGAVKAVRKAVTAGSEDIAKLFSTAQSALDTAAKRKTIHPNKAARLKSRLAKKLAPAPVAEAKPKKAMVKKTTVAKKPTTKKAPAKKTV